MAKRRKREGQPLLKVLGVPGLFSTAYGNVGSSIYYALGVVALAALGATPLIFILTGLLFCTTAWSYAEATAMVPEAGGSSSFARRAFNEFWSFNAGWALMLDYIVTIAISAFFVPNYLGIFWPILKTWPYNSIGGIITVILLVIINVIGIKEAATLNISLAVLDVVTQVLIMIIGLVLLLQPKLLITQVQWGVAPTFKQFIYGISIGTVAYTGIETISNMSEEASDPGKDVPRAINLVLAVVLVVYAGMSVVALSAMPVKYNVVPVDPATHLTVPVAVVPQDPKQPGGPYVFKAHPKQAVYIPVQPVPGGWETKSQEPTGKVTKLPDGTYATKVYGTWLGSVYLDDPVLGIVRNMPDSLGWLRAILGPWVGILAATILIIATNAGLIGVSRLAYSLGQHRQIPPILGRVHPKRLTPYVSIILFGIVACLIIVPGSTPFLADLYAFGAMISFTTAHLAVIALRIQEPDTPRSFRTPLSIPFHGKQLPLLSIIGAMGTFTVWCVVVATHKEGRLIGFIWMGVGLVVYVVYRKMHGYSLTQTVARIHLPATAAVDIEYDQILVPIVDSRIANEMMVLACQVAREKKSAIDALYVVEVPLNLPLDARLVKERAKGQAVLERAQAIADQFGVKANPILINARQAGRAIVDVARERHSEVIVLGSRRKRLAGQRRFGNTVDYVLEHAPTEVLHNLVPSDYPMYDEPLPLPAATADQASASVDSAGISFGGGPSGGAAGAGAGRAPGGEAGAGGDDRAVPGGPESPPSASS
jgi:basic amino acid/polyamine antiporter, APA family